MQKSTITVDVYLDENKVPEKIQWKATDSSVPEVEGAKALMMALWDGADKTAMRIDLWTKDMMVDEMLCTDDDDVGRIWIKTEGKKKGMMANYNAIRG